MSYKTEFKGDQLIITIDVSKQACASAPLSSSGKSRLVASTGGFKALNDKISFNLNLITK